MENQSNEVDAIVYFVNETFENLCPLQEIHITSGEVSKINFSLNASASNLNECFLVIKSTKDSLCEAQQIIKFDIKIAFSVGFDF